MADDIGKIIGGISAIAIILIFGTWMAIIISQLGEQQCQPYKNTIAQKDGEISFINQQLNETQKIADQCKQDYNALIKENITKKDIEEIKGYYNITQIQINNLNQKFDEVNNNYFNYYLALVKNYKISIIINLTIALTLISIEVLSFIFLKNEFIMFVINAIQHRNKKETHSLPKID